MTSLALVIGSSSSPSRAGSGPGSDRSHPLIVFGFPCNQPPSSGAFQKSPQEHQLRRGLKEFVVNYKRHSSPFST